MSTSNEMRPAKPFPRWLIFVAVLVTGATTVWAMMQTNLRGPRTSWGQAQGAVDQIWSDPAAAAAATAANGQAAVPGAQQAVAWADPNAAAAATGAARQVAGLPGVPTILNGTQRPHSDRGPCTNCHSVVTGDGGPMPVIHSFSSMPHGFRGVCNNCHEITIGRGLAGLVVAATAQAPEAEGQRPLMQPVMRQPLAPQAVMPQAAMQQPMMQQPMMQQPMMQQPMMQQPVMQQPVMQQPMMQQPVMQQQMMQPQTMAAPRAPANEADWRGMEVRLGAQGVVITNAEGTAARSGLQPGDLVTSINGANVRDVQAFVDATQNGSLRQGTVVVQRAGQRLAFELQPRVATAAPAPADPTMTGQMAVN